jgi:phosphatidylglycerol:prolipoprotein diacylglycerol transferase
MLPILLDLGFIKIYTFGVFLLLAFFWASFYLWKNILLTSFKEETIFDAVFLGLIGGMLFGRLEFVLSHLGGYSWDPLKFILINGYPGIGLLGFLTGFLATFLIFLKRQDISFKKIIDYIVPPLLLAIAIGKLGSFFSGTEIGTQTEFPISLIYKNIDGARHLTALYESILFFGATFASHLVLRSIRRDNLNIGFNFFFFIFINGLTFSLFDNLKSFRAIIQSIGLSHDFIISIFALLLTTFYFIIYFRSKIRKTFLAIWSKMYSNLPKIKN